MGDKVYLGDGVYAVWDGYALVLTTENGYEATSEIRLEPFVMNGLLAHWERVVKAAQSSAQANQPDDFRAYQDRFTVATATRGPGLSESEGRDG